MKAKVSDTAREGETNGETPYARENGHPEAATHGQAKPNGEAEANSARAGHVPPACQAKESSNGHASQPSCGQGNQPEAAGNDGWGGVPSAQAYDEWKNEQDELFNTWGNEHAMSDGWSNENAKPDASNTGHAVPSPKRGLKRAEPPHNVQRRGSRRCMGIYGPRLVDAQVDDRSDSLGNVQLEGHGNSNDDHWSRGPLPSQSNAFMAALRGGTAPTPGHELDMMWGVTSGDWADWRDGETGADGATPTVSNAALAPA